MPGLVRHNLVATTPDDPLYEIRPSHWNQDHDVSLTVVGSEVVGAFDNGGGITFGLETNGKITAAGPAQSNQTVGGYALGNTTGQSSNSTFDARSFSVSGAGVASVGWSNGALLVSVPAGGGGLTNINVSAGAQSNNLSNLVFSNSHNVSFGLNGSTITGSAGIWQSAGTTSNFGSAFHTANSNGVSFGIFGGTLTASVKTDYLTAIRVHAGTTDSLISALSFANSNGVSFGLNGGTVTATVKTDYVSGIRFSAGTTNNFVTGISFADANGVSFGINAGVITASHNGLTSQSNQALSGSNGSFAFQTATFGNLNGASFYTSNGSMVMSYTVPNVPAQTNQTLAIYAVGNTTGQSSSSTYDARTLSINGAGVASVGWSNGSFYVSVPAGGGGITNINLSAGTTSQNLSAFVLSNSHNVSFGLNGSTITASASQSVQTQLITMYAGGNTTVSTSGMGGANSIAIGGYGNISVGLSDVGPGGDVIVISGLGITNINVSAGTTSQNLSNFVFSNSNGVSFGLNGSTITASVNAGGGEGVTETMWWPYNEAVNMAGQVGNASLHIMPLRAQENYAFDRLVFPLVFTNTTSGTGTVTLSMWYALYTKNANTLSLMHSTSFNSTLAFNGTASSTNKRGIRLVTCPWTTTVTVGRYYVGVVSRTSTAGANASLSQMLISNVNSGVSGLWDVASNRSVQWPLGLGVRSASTAGVPNSLAFSDLDGTGTSVARAPSWYAVSGTV